MSFQSLASDCMHRGPSVVQDMLRLFHLFSMSLVFNCFIIRNKMQKFAVEIFGTLRHKLSLFDRLYDGKDIVSEIFKKLSMPLLPQVHSKFVMVGIPPCVDIYTLLLLYKPIHALSLCISHMMKECSLSMIWD